MPKNDVAAQPVGPADMVLMNLPNDPALLAAIGAVAVRHGQLDHILRMTVKTIEDLTPAQAVDAMGRQGSRDLRERVRRLAKARLGDGRPLLLLDALLERSRRATNRRNELLHGLWAQILDGPHVVRADGRWALAPAVADLNALAGELAQVAAELNAARLDAQGFLRVALEARAR